MNIDRGIERPEEKAALSMHEVASRRILLGAK